MTDADQPFIAAILANPDDDVPRLVYADYLDERGDPRGEFIRVQCELAAWPVERCDSIYPGCSVSNGRVVGHDHKCPMAARQSRERELLETYMPPQSAAFAWSQPIHETGIALGRWWPDVFTFRRGFVESIRCSLSNWLAHGPAILAACPIREVVCAEPAGTVVIMVRRGRGGPYLWRFAAEIQPADRRQRMQFFGDDVYGTRSDMVARHVAAVERVRDRLSRLAYQDAYDRGYADGGQWHEPSRPATSPTPYGIPRNPCEHCHATTTCSDGDGGRGARVLFSCYRPQFSFCSETDARYRLATGLSPEDSAHYAGSWPKPPIDARLARKPSV